MLICIKTKMPLKGLKWDNLSVSEGFVSGPAYGVFGDRTDLW